MDDLLDIFDRDDVEEGAHWDDTDAAPGESGSTEKAKRRKGSLAVWQRIEAHHERLAMKRLLQDELD